MEWWCLDIRSHIASSFTILLLRFLLNFSFDWKRYQTLKTLFNHIFKHVEVRQKYSCARHFLTSLARHDLSFFIHYSCNSKLLPQVRKREIIVVCLDIWFLISNILLIIFLFIFNFHKEDISNARNSVLIIFLNTTNFVKNTPLLVKYSPLFCEWKCRTLSFVLEIQVKGC